MEYNNIGKITGTHGLDGKVVLRHNLDGKNALSRILHLFIEERRKSYIPYFLEEKKAISQDEVLLKLDEVDSVEAAKAFTGKNVFLEEEVFQQLKPKAVSSGMIGFKIVDKQIGLLGAVQDIFETPGQVLATVIVKGKEVIVPLVNATIISVDGAARVINVDLPEGLLDVYL